MAALPDAQAEHCLMLVAQLSALAFGCVHISPREMRCHMYLCRHLAAASIQDDL